MHRDSVTSELEFLQRRVRELESQARRASAEGGGIGHQAQQNRTPDRHSPPADNRQQPPPQTTAIDSDNDNDEFDDNEGGGGGGDSTEGQDGDDGDSDTDVVHQPDKRRDTSDTVIKDAASILEFLAWGRRKDPEHHPTTTGRRNSVGDRSTTAVSSTADTVGKNIGMAMVPMLEEADELKDTLYGEFGSHHHNGQAPNSSDPFGDNSTRSPLAVMQMLLPSRRQVEQLVDYHIECLLWYHASFLGPHFRANLAAFYDRCDGQVEAVEENRGVADLDLQWVALLFSVLSGTLTCAPAQQALTWGFRAPESHALCKHWFQAALACLTRDQYMANHSVHSCQAIATMTISAHLLGFSNTQSIQLAAAVRIAQSLGLHRLGENDDGLVTADIEQGRRVWNQLCSQDWFGIPFSESYLVNPLHSQTAKPANVHDEDLESSSSSSSPPPVQPETEPTVSGYCRFLNTIASIMPRLQDGLLSCNTAYTRYQQVLSWDAHMRTLATADRPRFLSSQVPIQQHWPCWIPWARRALAISSGHKIIMIHRSCLSESFTNPAFAFTRHTCIAASKTIIKEYKAVVREEGPVLWVHQAFSVAASIILILDVLHRGPGDDQARQNVEHAHLVEDVVSLLRQFPHSMIAVRGIRLLRALLDEVGGIDATTRQMTSEEPVVNSTSTKKRKRNHITATRDTARHSFPSIDDHTSPPSRKRNGFNVPAFIQNYCQGDQAGQRRKSSSRPHHHRWRHHQEKLPGRAVGNTIAEPTTASDTQLSPHSVHKDRLPDNNVIDTVDITECFTVGSDDAIPISGGSFPGAGPLDVPMLLPPGWESTNNGFENLLYLANHDFSLL